MYAVWWHKPLDIDISIPTDRHTSGLVNDSITSDYIATARAIFEKSEKNIILAEHTVHAEDNSDGVNSNAISNGNRPVPQHRNTTNSVIEHSDPKVAMALAIFRSIEPVPKDASRLFEVDPRAIKSVLASFNLAIYMRPKRIRLPPMSLAIAKAAYKVALTTANEAAFSNIPNLVLEDFHKICR